MLEQRPILTISLCLMLSLLAHLGLLVSVDFFGDEQPTELARSEPDQTEQRQPDPEEEEDVPPPELEEPEYTVGTTEPSPLEINYISFEDYEILQSKRAIALDQPTVQMTVTPDPNAQQTPIDPTEPGIPFEPIPSMASAPAQPAQPESWESQGTAERLMSTGDLVERFTVPPAPLITNRVEITNAPTELDELAMDDERAVPLDRTDGTPDERVTRQTVDAEQGLISDPPLGNDDRIDTPESRAVVASAQPAPQRSQTNAADIVVNDPDVDVPAQPGSKADPTAAPRIDAEADPVSRIESAHLVPGGVWAQHGIRIKTVRPRWPIVTRMTAVPRNPIVRITFNGEGKVTGVRWVRTSGWKNIDGPLRIAIYKWSAEGNFPEEGFTIEEARIILNGTPEIEEETEDQTEPTAAPGETRQA